MALSPQNFTELNMKNCSGAASFDDFDFRIALAPQRGANFVDILGSRSSAPARF